MAIIEPNNGNKVLFFLLLIEILSDISPPMRLDDIPMIIIDKK